MGSTAGEGAEDAEPSRRNQAFLKPDPGELLSGAGRRLP